MVSFSIFFACITKYKYHINEVNYAYIEFPLKINDISKMEAMNDIRFKVFGLAPEDKRGHIYPLYISPKKCQRKCECSLRILSVLKTIFTEMFTVLMSCLCEH